MATGGGALTGGALASCALAGGAFTRGADWVDREPAGIDSVGSLESGRSRSSVANRVVKKAVKIETTSTGVSTFQAEPGRVHLLESGGRFLDMANG